MLNSWQTQEVGGLKSWLLVSDVGTGLAGALSPAIVTDVLREATAKAFESTLKTCDFGGGQRHH
jgi:hypothetical protein